MTAGEGVSGGAVFRLLTPRAAGGVAVVVAAGPGHREAVARILRRPSGAVFEFDRVGPQRALLWLDDEPVDEVLVLARAASVEICPHGAPAVVRRLEQAVGGFSLAPGTPADALLRSARSEAQLGLALEQRERPWRDHMAWLAGLPADRRRCELEATLARSRAAMALAQPTRVVLCGRTNAGKSTLLNRLLLEERALVGATAGTTLDPVREHTALAGYPYELVDTAGAGGPGTELERAAQEVAAREREAALTVLVVDGSRGLSPEDEGLRDGCRFTVCTKSDLPAGPWPEGAPPDLTVSCVDAGLAPRIRTAVGEMLRRGRGLPPAGPVGGAAALDEEQMADLDRITVG